jgi:hypothetical protein
MTLAATTPGSRKFVIRSIPISDCSDQCEWHGSGRVMAGERHGNGMVCVNPSLRRQGKSRETAWEQHGNGMVCVNRPLPCSCCEWENAT